MSCSYGLCIIFSLTAKSPHIYVHGKSAVCDKCNLPIQEKDHFHCASKKHPQGYDVHKLCANKMYYTQTYTTYTYNGDE